MKIMASIIAGVLIALGTGIGIVSAKVDLISFQESHKKTTTGPCSTFTVGTLQYSYCALKVTYPRNIVICNKNVPTESLCELEVDGDGDPYFDTFGDYNGTTNDMLVWGPISA